MRPPRPDVAAPEFPSGVEWVNSLPLRMAAMNGRLVVLVHFWDFAQLNSLRTLPYLAEWHRRYVPAGFRVVAVHSPRYPFSADPDAVRDAVGRLGIEHPVAIDSGHELWADYGVEGWPSTFLWSSRGALAYFHFGEGEYRATEEAIQELLGELDSGGEMPAPMEPVRPTDARGALVVPPTPELLPGGSTAKPWRAGSGEDRLEVEYEAGGASVTLAGAGVLLAALDGRDLPPVSVGEPGLYELAEHAAHSRHRLELRPDRGVEVYSVSFPPAPAG